jgi:hypothetical protein
MIQHRVDKPVDAGARGEACAYSRAFRRRTRQPIVAHAKLLPEGSIEVHARGDDTLERHSFELTIGHSE